MLQKSEVCFKGMVKSLSRVLGKVQKELQGSFKGSLGANLSDFQGILKYTLRGFQVCEKVQRCPGKYQDPNSRLTKGQKGFQKNLRGFDLKI